MDDTANEVAAVEKSANNAETEIGIKPTETSYSTVENEATKSGNTSKKDSSLEEDLLGAHSLMMSDSDGDDEDDGGSSRVKSQIYENPQPLVREMSKDIGVSELNDEQTNSKDFKTVSLIQILPQKKKKISAILDSDTEDDESECKMTHTQNTEVNKVKTKISALIDTDSETDDLKNEFITENNATQNTNNYKAFDFDDEDKGENESQVSKKQKSKKLKNKKQRIKVGIIDSDSESNSDTASSGDETANDTFNDEKLESANQVDGSKAKNKTKQPKQMRASAQKALDDIQSIQSEQQRLHREAHVSIPYHKPKRHTLQEFLRRRTIIKPATDSECSSAVASLRQKRLKMTAEELEEYAQLMEDRAKEAKEFFKSESETEEEEEELKPNAGVMDIQEPIDEAIENEITKENETDKNVITEIKVDDVETQQTEAMDTEQLLECDIQPESSIPLEINELKANEITKERSTQPIVTEILELPRLDLSTLHLTEEHLENILSPSKQLQNDDEKPEEIKTTILNELQSTQSPRLKGDANMLIDLDSGDLIAKKPTGADNLLQRLLATHKANKLKKVNETVNILSSENGKLEMTKVNFHPHEETEVTKEQKPGAAYLKLKENLKALIKKKRLEELQKKQDDEDEYNKCLEGDEDFEIDEDGEYEIENDRKVKQEKNKSNYEKIIIDDEENALELDNADEDDEENDEEDVDDEEGDIEFDPVDKKDEENIDNFIDDEAEDDEVEEESDTDSDSEEEDENDDEKVNKTEFKEPFLTATQRKSRIIKAFASDSEHEDEDDDDMDLLKTQPPIAASNVITPLFGVIESPLKKNLRSTISSINTDEIRNTQELLELCSGTFDATQTSASTDAMVISQIPMTLQNSQTDTTRELLALCSGSFDNQQQSQQQTHLQQESTTVNKSTELESQRQQPAAKQDPKHINFKILSSDEEEAADAGKDSQNRVKKLRKKAKRRQAKLGFSDDEDETGGVTAGDAVTAESEAENFEDENVDVDMPETYVEYDSEENEIIVEMTKTDCIKHAGNFFEKEAELSESEWGSADEDEKNLDHYDIELGDEDNFDREKLQQELGQIHARKMLDEDIREVRRIQEMLFEDEENDGVGRQRQFRWKNAESGFSLDDMNRNEDGGFGFNGGAESGDEEQKQEHVWRKIRYEREQLLKEQGIIENSQEFLVAKLGVNSPLASLSTTHNIENTNKIATPTPIIGSNGKKMQIITQKSTTLKKTASTKKASPFLISSVAKKSATPTMLAPKPLANFTPPSTSTILQPKAERGSFLMRDKESLTKFVNFTKGIGSIANLDDDEAAGTVSIKSTKAKNFVFATITKEEHEHLKRKADDLIKSSSENGTNFMKKKRPNQHSATTGKQCFIDKLL